MTPTCLDKYVQSVLPLLYWRYDAMADLRVEKIPDELLRALKIRAAQEGTTLRALVIELLTAAVGRKAGKA